MANNDLHTVASRPAGYAALVTRLGLHVIPNWHESSVAEISGTHRVHSVGNILRETYPPQYWPGEGLGDHLEFALKYDGTNLATLANIFRAMDVHEFTQYVQSKPTGKYARRLWYLYELITGERLPLEDLTRGNYTDLLDAETYYTTSKVRLIRRQRIYHNLLGNAQFCPVIRRTPTLQKFEKINFQQRCQQVVAAYPPELLRRALSYLYTKETRTSFEIEHIKPDAKRTERFITLLELAERED